MQEAFLRAFRSFRQFRGGSAARLAVRDRAQLLPNRAIGRGRGAVSLVVSDSGLSDEAAASCAPADPAPGPEEELLRKAEVDRVRAAIEAIPEPFRETLVLRELEDLSYAEIAT